MTQSDNTNQGVVTAPKHLRLEALGILTDCSDVIFRLDPWYCKTRCAMPVKDHELKYWLGRLAEIINRIEEINL